MPPAERPARSGRLARRVARVGVRGRLVVVGVAVVLVALLAGSTALVYLLQSNLERSTEDAARARAAEVVSLVAAEGVAATVGGLPDEVRTGSVVQLLTADGRVVGASDRRAATEPMSPQRPAVGTYSTTDIDIDNLGSRGDWTVVSTGVASAGQAYVVQVAVPVRVQRETVQTVGIFLLGTTPLLLAGVAVAVWQLVGRALRPVESIRADVAAIDARRLADRVEVPPTADEIAALATTMNAMLDRLQASSAAQRAFVSDASHELRSPLATLSTAAELAVRADEATRTRLLGTIETELVRMRGLVDNLMTLARADAQDLVLSVAEVDLDDLVDDEVHRLRATSRAEVAATVVPVRVWADRQRVAQALRNVVDNAQRHARSTVRLTLRVAGPTAVLEVDNDGPPVAPADRERVFERFVRLDDSRSRDLGGSGLGLAITRTAMRSQHGEVTAGEAPDGWCRFTLTLPVEVEAAEVGPAVLRPADPHPGALVTPPPPG